MKLQSVVLSGCLLAFGWLSGCGESPDAVDEEPDLNALMQTPSETVYHEWRKVYSVETREKELVRTHVGFLDKRYTLSDQEGRLFVVDRAHEDRGFILPSGRAYVIEGRKGGEKTPRNLGVCTFETAVKKILDVPGGIEAELMKEASKGPGES